MNRICPTGAEQWDSVVAEHRQQYPSRDKDAIRQKYNLLHQKNIPTGDPNCPEEVKLAKHVKYYIGQKACLGDAEQEFDLEEVDFGENGGNPNPNPDPEPNPETVKATLPSVGATANVSSDATSGAATNRAATNQPVV